MFVIGKPGSGKSKLLEWLWAWMQSQLTPLHHAKQHTAYDGAMIAFDTKDDGQLTRGLSDWSAVTGVHTTVIDIAADTPMPLSIFSKEGTLRQRSERVLDALSYLIGGTAAPGFERPPAPSFHCHCWWMRRSRTTVRGCRRTLPCSLTRTSSLVPLGLAPGGAGRLRVVVWPQKGVLMGTVFSQEFKDEIVEFVSARVVARFRILGKSSICRRRRCRIG